MTTIAFPQSLTIARSILNMAKARDTERTSIPLAGVSVTFKGNAVIIAATNGHVLAEEVITLEGEACAPMVYIIRVDPLNKRAQNPWDLLKTLCKGKTPAPFSILFEFNRLSVGNEQTTVGLDLITATYPAYAQAFEPKAHRAVCLSAVWGISSRYLGIVSDIMGNAALRSDLQGMGIIFSPLTQGPRIRVMVMPIACPESIPMHFVALKDAGKVA